MAAALMQAKQHEVLSAELEEEAAPTMSHSDVVQGTCNSCHNGTTAKGKNSSHVSTHDGCDACHRTGAWTPAAR